MVNIDYTLVAANVFAKTVAPQMSKGRRFRFIYTSGLLAENKEGESMWFMKDSRIQKVKRMPVSRLHVLTKR